jgi:hypothetical protein
LPIVRLLFMQPFRTWITTTGVFAKIQVNSIMVFIHDSVKDGGESNSDIPLYVGNETDTDEENGEFTTETKEDVDVEL